MESVLKTTLLVYLLFCCSCASHSESENPRYFEEGNRSFAHGQYHNAELAYRKALERNPDSGECYYRLAQAQWKQNRLGAGLASLKQAAKFLPGNAEVRVKLADIYLAACAGQSVSRESWLRELHEVWKELRIIDPNGYETLRVGGYLALAENRTESALDLLGKANAAKPGQPPLVLVLARTSIAAGRAKDGEQLALALLEKEKSFGPIYDLLYFHYKASRRSGAAEAILKAKAANNPKVSGYRLQLAAHCARLGKQAEMQATLRPLLEDPKAFPSGRLDVGDFYYRLGKWSDAIAHYEEGLKANPKQKAVFQRRISDALFRQGKVEEAGSVIAEILKENPDDAYGRGAKASLLLRSNEPWKIREAVAEFQKLAKESPANAEIRMRLGQAYLVNREIGPAQHEFREAIRLRDDSIPARIALAEISLARRDYHDALRYADEILVRSTNDPQAMLLRVAAHIGLENYAEARAELRAVLGQSPGSTDARIQSGLLEIAERNYAEAERIFRGLYRPGKSDARVLRGLVKAKLARGQFGEALGMLDRELDSGARSTAEVRALLFEVAHRAGKNAKNQALASLRRARDAAPNDPKGLLALGTFLQRNQQFAEAQECFRRAIALEPENPFAMNNLAFSMAEGGGDLGAAQRIAESARLKWPQQPNIADTLGWIYLKQNKIDDSLRIFAELARQYPRNPTFHYHLGAAWLQKGDRAAARRELETALAAGPSEEEADRINAAVAGIVVGAIQ